MKTPHNRNNKKRLIICSAVILCTAALLLCIGFFRTFINPVRVDKIILYSAPHTGCSGHAELSAAEVQKFIALYNTSRYIAEITAEPCCDEFWLEIYLNDGNAIRISEGTHSKMIVKPVSGNRFYVESVFLRNYIASLMAAYSLGAD